jgi:hypothetical protein
LLQQLVAQLLHLGRRPCLCCGAALAGHWAAGAFRLLRASLLVVAGIIIKGPPCRAVARQQHVCQRLHLGGHAPASQQEQQQELSPVLVDAVEQQVLVVAVVEKRAG